MRKKAKLAAAAVAAACLTNPARADLSYQYVTDASTYTTSAGGTVTVNVFLQETFTSGTPTLIGPSGSEKGLFSAGIAANLLTGSATITGATLNNNTASNPFTGGTTGAGFGGTSGASAGQTNVSSDNKTAAIYDQINFGTTVPKAYSLNSTVNQLYLGSFTVTTSASGGSSTFSITSFNNSNNSLAVSLGDSTVTSPTGFLLDLNGNDPSQPTSATFTGTESFTVQFTVTTSAVPEPSSMLLCGLAAGGMGFSLWRRRKAQAAQTEETQPSA